MEEAARNMVNQSNSGCNRNDEQVLATDDSEEQGLSQGSPILNTPTFRLRKKNSHRNNQPLSGVCIPSQNSSRVDCNLANHGSVSISPKAEQNCQSSNFIVPKTPVQKTMLQNSLFYHESDSEDMFASDTSECDDRGIPNNLDALFNGPEPSDMSWTSSMATPMACDATCSNLNTEERKVLLPSGDCSNVSVKPRALFTSDLNDTSDSFNLSSGFETPKTLHKNSSCDPKRSVRGLVTPDMNSSASSKEEPEHVHEKVTGDSPILSGSSEFKSTSYQICDGDEDLFENTEEFSSVASCSQTNVESERENNAAESTPNPRSSGTSVVRMRESLSIHKSDLHKVEAHLKHDSVTAGVSHSPHSKISAVPSKHTPGKPFDTKRRRLLFSSSEAHSNPALSEFKAPEPKHTEKGMESHSEDPADSIIPDDSFTEHLAAINVSIFSDPVMPLSKVQSIKSSVSHMKKFCYGIDEKSASLPNKDCTSTSKPQDVIKEILAPILAQESCSFVSIKTKPLTPTGNLVAFSQLQARLNEETAEERPAHTKTDIQSPVNNLDSADTHVKLPVSEGFQTASGHVIQLSQESIRKGLNLLKNAMEDNIDFSKLSSNMDLYIGCSQTLDKSSSDVKPHLLNDDQEAEEVKQLLQLVHDGEDFHPWDDSEQRISAESEESAIKPVAHSPSGSGNINSCGTNNNAVVDVESHAVSFSTASGRNISVSEKSLANAKHVFEKDSELTCMFIDLPCSNAKEDCVVITEHHNQPNSENVNGGSSHVEKKRKAVQTLVHPTKKSCPSSPPSSSNFCKNLDLEHFKPPPSEEEGKFRDHCKSPPILEPPKMSLAGPSKSSTALSDMNMSAEGLSLLSNLFHNPKKNTTVVTELKAPVSFSSASGKPVQVSEQALSKARGIFNAVAEESHLQPNEKELQAFGSLITHSICSQNDDVCEQKNLTIPTNALEEAPNKVKISFDDLPEMKHAQSGCNLSKPLCSLNENKKISTSLSHTSTSEEESSESNGFLTASGKVLSVSKQAMDKVKNIFEGLSTELPVQYSNSDGKILNGTSCVTRLQARSDTNDFSRQGFSTASGKTVTISEDALKKVKSLFDSENLPPVSLHNLDDTAIHPSQVTLTENSTTSEVGKPNSIGSVNLAGKTSGFSTASGRTVNVSKAALRKATNLFNQVQSEPSVVEKHNHTEKEDSLDHAPQTGGFSTASGRHVKVSRDALAKAKALFDDVPSDENVAPCSKSSNIHEQKSGIGVHQGIEACDSPQPAQEMKGFSTAGGRRVTVSKESLTKVKALFDDMPSDENVLSHSKSRNVEELKNIAEERYHTDAHVSSDQAQEIGGFSTAGGRHVKISKDALSKAKALFDDIPKDENVPDFPRSSNAKGRNVGNGDLKCVEATVSSEHTLEMRGFSTAGGQQVKVSKDAMTRAKALFDDIPNDENLPALSRSSILKEPENRGGDPHQTEAPVSPDYAQEMRGFSTAGGRHVKVSKDALTKAKALFDDIPNDENVPPLPKSSSLVGPKNVIREHCTETNVFMDNAQESEGFSTAGGKRVKVSKDALTRAKALFDDLPDNGDIPLLSKSSSAKNVSVDDSGISMSHENTFNESSSILTGNLSKVSTCKLSSPTKSTSKEKKSVVKERVTTEPDFCDVQKFGLTQEISESTAALLADESFLAADTLPTISTSPSMITDRCGDLEPFVLSVPDSRCKLNEPTSPILVRSDAGSRRRSRRGRLSLSTSIRSGSPTLGSQPNASLTCHQKSRLSLPATYSSGSFSSSAHDHREAIRNPKVTSSSGHELHSQEKVATGVRAPPLRKLFSTESASLPKVAHPKPQTNYKTPLKTDPPAHSTSDKNDYDARSSSLALPMKKDSCQNSGTQSSGFKTPYKLANGEQMKRQPSSPPPDPPEAKRKKICSNLYVYHFLSSSHELGSRTLRPEVAEMRRRAAQEQQELVEKYAELKGDLLQRRTGSWLAGRTSGDPLVKFIKLADLGGPGDFSSHDLKKIGLQASTVSISASNCADFRFSAWDYYSEDLCRENVAGIPVGDGALLVLDVNGTAGVEEFERSFLASPGVDPSLVPSGWIKNHYRWLVWKLSALECRFPHHLGRRCFSPHVLMLQLKYRYDREVDRCERPALRRIFEHDDSAAKRMVLCVANIMTQKDSNDQVGGSLELELTDGWYSIVASIDQDMQHRVRKGVISIGTKLVMHGAELLNCPDGCFPLQSPSEVRLKISSNSSRRARWFVKLGFQGNPGPMRISLGSILSSGGHISCVSAYVARVYPIVFMEKREEKTVVRSQRAESKEVAKYERRRQQLAETLLSQVRAEVQKEQLKRRKSTMKVSLKYISTITSGEELAEVLENASDPLSVQNMLTMEQRNSIADYQRIKQEELHNEVDARVRLRLSENSNHDRQTTAILKVRLTDCSGSKQRNCAILSVWRPSEDIQSIFKEGLKISIFGAVANGLRGGELQLSTNRSTRYHVNSSVELSDDCIRSVSPIFSLSSVGFVPRFGELDIVGIVVRVCPAPQTTENSSRFQLVYVSDSSKNIVCLSFWEGLKEFGVEDLITPNSVIAASNLQWRGGPVVRAIPCVYASELSAFTTNPRLSYLQRALQELRRLLPSDIKMFCKTCEEKIDDLLLQNTPSRVPRMYDHATPTSKLEDSISSSSGLSAMNHTSVNSLDAIRVQRKLSMEQQTTPLMVSKGLSPAVEKRIAKLDIYGEPPPISPIIVSNSRRASRRFKAPRRADSTSTPTGNEKNDTPLKG